MLTFDHHLFFLSWISQDSIFFIALPWSRLQEHCAPCHPQIHPEKLNVSAVPPRALESQTKKEVTMNDYKLLLIRMRERHCEPVV
jgi:hypothetical protein